MSISSNPVGVNQSSSFLLPEGNYTVTGTQGNSSQIGPASVTDGSTASLTLTFHIIAARTAGSSSPYPTIELILVAAAGAAAVANGALRLLSSKSLGAKMAKASKPAEALVPSRA